MVDGRARDVGEERVPRLGDEEAEDGEHGDAAVLGLGLAVAADVVVRRLGREAGRVPLAHGRERAGQVEAEALLGGEAGREAVLRLGDLVELALRGELRRGGLGRRRDERGRRRDGEGEGELGEGHCCSCLRAEARVRCGQLQCCARHARGRGRATRGCTARNVAQRTRVHCAAPFATRERAVACAARFLLAAEEAARVSAAYAPHALQNAVLLCTNERMGALSSTRDAAGLDAVYTSCDVRFCLAD